MITDRNYIHISAFMIKDLKLKGNELLLYAIIYGFSQDGESSFSGSRNYLSEFLNVSKPTIDSALNSLCDKGYIIKITETKNRVIFNYYKINTEILDFTGGKEILPGSKEILPPPSKETLHNNNIYNNNYSNKENVIINNNTKEIEDLFNFWNYCNIINHSKLTEDMKQVLKTRLNEYDVEQLKECISHYNEAYHSEYEYCKYKWNLLTFFKQKNAYLDFMEDGSKWNNYLRWKNENNVSYNFDTTNEQQRELQYYKNLKNTNKQKYDEELEQLQYWKPELYEYIYNQLENGGFEEL